MKFYYLLFNVHAFSIYINFKSLVQPLKSPLLKLYLKQLSHSLELFLRRQNVVLIYIYIFSLENRKKSAGAKFTE